MPQPDQTSITCHHCEKQYIRSTTHLSKVICQECVELFGSHTNYLKTLTIKQYATVINLDDKPLNKAIRSLGRTWNTQYNDLPCAACSYSKHTEIAHIKDISLFPTRATLWEVNHPANLIPLCRNHHFELDNGLLDEPTKLLILKWYRARNTEADDKLPYRFRESIKQKLADLTIAPEYKCSGCGKDMKVEGMCGRCKVKAIDRTASRKIVWPDVNELALMVWERPLVAVGKELGVSDNAVFKMCKRWGIKLPKKGYWRRKKRVKPISLMVKQRQ